MRFHNKAKFASFFLIFAAVSSFAANGHLYIDDGSGIKSWTVTNNLAESGYPAIAGEGYEFDDVSSTLKLSGFHGKSIEADFELNISVAGTANTITPDNDARFAIKTGNTTNGVCQSLNISGSGSANSALRISAASTSSFTALQVSRVDVTCHAEITDINLKIENESSSYSSAFSGYYIGTNGDANLDISFTRTSGTAAWEIIKGVLYQESTGNLNITVNNSIFSDEALQILYAKKGTVNIDVENGKISNDRSRYYIQTTDELQKATFKGILASRLTLGSNYTITSPEVPYYFASYTPLNLSYAMLSFATDAPITNFVIEKPATTIPLSLTDHPKFDIPAGNFGDEIASISIKDGRRGGTSPYTYTADNLPKGLSISNGIISGKFEEAGPAGEATITVTDAKGNSASIVIAYGAVAAPPKYIEIGETETTKFNTLEDQEKTYWSYKAETKTLTLKDGFTGKFISSPESELVIVVKGTVTLNPDADSAIAIRTGKNQNEYHPLDIIGDGASASTLIIEGTVNREFYAMQTGSYMDKAYISINNLTLNVNLQNGEGRSNKVNAAETQGFFIEGDAVANIILTKVGTNRNRWFGVNAASLNHQSTGNLNIKINNSQSDDYPAMGLKFEGTGEANIDIANGYAVSGWYGMTIGKNAGKITLAGMIGKTFTIPGGYNILSDTPPFYWKSSIMTSLVDDTPITYLVIGKPNTAMELTFTDSDNLDIPGGNVGVSIAEVYTYGSVNGGTRPYTFSATNLPAGFSINATTGTISGKATATFTEEGDITVTVTDASGNSKSIDIHHGEFGIRPALESIAFQSEEYIVEKGSTIEIGVDFIPSLATGSVTYSTSPSTNIGTFNGNSFQASLYTDAGKYALIATSNPGNFKASADLYIKEGKPHAKFEFGKLYQLERDRNYRIIYSEDGSEKTVEFSTSESQSFEIPYYMGNQTIQLILLNSESKCNSDPEEIEIGAVARKYDLVLKVNDETMGSVTGGGRYTEGYNVRIDAHPNEHYHFVNWDIGGTAAWTTVTITGDMEVTANFAIDQFTVTFVDHFDQAIEAPQTINYGGSATAPAAPLFEGHKFSGWDNEFTNVTDNIVVKALYDVETYDVELKLDGGTPSFNLESYTFGVGATLPGMSKTGYDFLGWYDNENGTGTNVVAISKTDVGNKTFYAIFSLKKFDISLSAIPENSGILSIDGEEISTKQVGYGTDVIIKAVPNAGKRFIKWSDGNVNEERSINVTEPITLSAEFEDIIYTITFKDYDDTELECSATYKYKEKPTCREPSRSSTDAIDYAFDGWSPSIALVTENATYTATYKETPRKYIITFIQDDGSKIEELSFAYGEDPAPTTIPVKASTEQYSYPFDKWEPSLETVTGNKTYTAIFIETVNKYTITFVDEAGETIHEEEFPYGETPACSATLPSKEGDAEYSYEVSWTPELAPVTENTTYTLNFKPIKNKYDVVVSVNNKAMGSVAGAGNYEYGSTVTLTANASDYYHFTNWIDDAKAAATRNIVVSGNMEYKANFAANVYKVELNANGGTIEKALTEYTYGKGATLPKATKKGFTFSGWFADSKFSGSAAKEIGANDNGDKKFYAKWTEEKAITSSSSSKAVSSSSATKTSSSSNTKPTSSSSSVKPASSSSAKPTAIAAAPIPSYNVHVSGFNVQVSGAHIGSSIALMDMQGRMIFHDRVKSANFAIKIPRAGNFILRIGNQVKQVNVK